MRRRGLVSTQARAEAAPSQRGGGHGQRPGPGQRQEVNPVTFPDLPVHYRLTHRTLASVIKKSSPSPRNVRFVCYLPLLPNSKLSFKVPHREISPLPSALSCPLSFHHMPLLPSPHPSRHHRELLHAGLTKLLNGLRYKTTTGSILLRDQSSSQCSQFFKC